MEMILTDIQILSILICGVLSLVSYKVRIPTIAVIPAVGFFLLGFEIYTASDNLLVLGLFIMTAIVQFVICFGAAERR